MPSTAAPNAYPRLCPPLLRSHPAPLYNDAGVERGHPRERTSMMSGVPRRRLTQATTATADSTLPLRRNSPWHPPNDPNSEIQFRQEDGQGPQATGQLRPPDAPVHPDLQRVSFKSHHEWSKMTAIVNVHIDPRVNNTEVRDQFLWDICNLESDPEEFARTLCDDLNITDPEVGKNKLRACID